MLPNAAVTLLGLAYVYLFKIRIASKKHFCRLRSRRLGPHTVEARTREQVQATSVAERGDLSVRMPESTPVCGACVGRMSCQQMTSESQPKRKKRKRRKKKQKKF